MSKPWRDLVAHYADGRPICNCGEAYYTPCGRGSRYDEKSGRRVEFTDGLACQYGCQANKLIARDDIATRVVADLELNKAPA